MNHRKWSSVLSNKYLCDYNDKIRSKEASLALHCLHQNAKDKTSSSANTIKNGKKLSKKTDSEENSTSSHSGDEDQSSENNTQEGVALKASGTQELESLADNARREAINFKEIVQGKLPLPSEEDTQKDIEFSSPGLASSKTNITAKYNSMGHVQTCQATDTISLWFQ